MGTALLLAVFADRDLRGRGVYRTLLIWPYAVAPAIAEFGLYAEPVLLDAPTIVRNRQGAVSIQASTSAVVVAIRDGDWKLIESSTGERALYNLATDLGETTNVAADHPEIVEIGRASCRERVSSPV